MFNSVILLNMSIHSVSLFFCIVILYPGVLKHSDASEQPSISSSKELSKLVLFSFDGFRDDFIDPVDTPNLYAFSTNGVRGENFDL